MSRDRPLAVYTDVDDLDSGPGVAALEAAGFEVVVLETRDSTDIVDASRAATALLVGYAPITSAMIAAMPELRIIALLSMGTDGVDVTAATARGIWVCHIRDVATAEVATHAWMLTLALVRGLPFFQAAVRAGNWLARPGPLPRRLSDITLGLVGLGRIGTAFAQLAAGQVAGVIAYDPFVPTDQAPHGVRRGSLAEVVSGADVLSLHLPLTPDNHHLVDAELLADMKPGAFLVNVSRGALVDSSALVRALRTGHLAGAALDVLESEPPAADDPLLQLPNLLLTPHIGYLSGSSARAYIDSQVANVVTWHRTGQPVTPVNSPVGQPVAAVVGS